MDKKRIRLVLFSTWGSDYKQVEFSLSTFASLLAGGVFVLLLLGAGLLYGSKLAFHSLYIKLQERQQARLIERFAEWHNRVEDLAHRYDKTLGSTHSLALTMQAPADDDSTAWLDGRGGAFVDEDDNILPRLTGGKSEPEANPEGDEPEVREEVDLNSLNPSELIDYLESRLSDTREAHQIIFEKFEERRKQLEHIPSIKPIFNGRVTDFFGKRIDPFVRRIRHHRGLDIAAPHGTPVYSPASGTVEFVKTRYVPRRGYGRVVIINHGYGMKTLYGHLSKVNVSIGQRIERWDVIGMVGETGRATGPHLHYEVWLDGKARDPEEFIINE
ncbi:MAG: M23 family metallopeptidase [candidate division KSB1 bacterium]|nr:M23 family metallopeptidase [candidate division KSB1 bacterium]MDZ7274881.1 M23 family metallopeptidase [candidate division KSB1 bacterium]MDZ7286667.1 M23 family metallopeptidase [candidate division KSB1 bacterium]MDZ7299170.1 M23 family metallopeptidase [candidate division KSB1 bacterium]MDZ7307020.1 M23 family metallopeptidase [candidate division KSB1 bacterium]